MFGITESGRDKWLIEAEWAFLLKRGWKYDIPPPRSHQPNQLGDDADLLVAKRMEVGAIKWGLFKDI